MIGLSQLITILLYLAVIFLFRFDPTNFFAMVLLPFGALIFGCLGSLGALPGAKIAQYPVDARLRNIMIGTSMTAFVVYLLIVAAVINWADSSHPGVITSLVQLQTQTEFAFSKGTHEIGNLGEVGAWGFLLLALKFAGVAGGSWAYYSSLRLIPYCSSCRVFNRTREKGTLYFHTFDAWVAEMKKVPTEPWRRAAHMLSLPRQKALSIPGKNYVLVRLYRHECPRCHEQHMREQVQVHNGSQLVAPKELASAYSWLPSQAQSKKVTPEPQGGVGGFGRKVI
ncbi:hypothetical protein [Altererythrobacter sp. ZODW24]|uniref:hypothetical protein n=1 Tax=Altererythrobacter sp. ZODW24 TaxID=2185142 RepID=UPI0013B43206|nr:hypothetical protein [Altererythrobacter sp. ZODW24]